jgi:hypothetical protein
MQQCNLGCNLVDVFVFLRLLKRRFARVNVRASALGISSAADDALEPDGAKHAASTQRAHATLHSTARSAAHHAAAEAVQQQPREIDEMYCSGAALALYRRSTDVALALYRRCTDVALALYRRCTDVAPTLHRRCTDVAPALHRRCLAVRQSNPEMAAMLNDPQQLSSMLNECVRVCVRVHVRACVRACRACVLACAASALRSEMAHRARKAKTHK